MPRKTTTSTTKKPQAAQATDLAGDRFEKFRARGMAMQNRAGHRRRTFGTTSACAENTLNELGLL